ncbi:MAG: hypothetical protein JW934_16375 [Anaerolineae bacterium]|nr:hypothetical protein [Anaerolineae bacterium]
MAGGFQARKLRKLIERGINLVAAFNDIDRQEARERIAREMGDVRAPDTLRAWSEQLRSTAIEADLLNLLVLACLNLARDIPAQWADDLFAADGLGRADMSAALRQVVAAKQAARATDAAQEASAPGFSGSAFVPILPKLYVPRSIEREIVDLLLSSDHPQSSHPRGVVLHGFGGFGKTTLAAAVAQSEQVASFFSSGVFWLSAREDDAERWFERWRLALGLTCAPGERAQACWQRWAASQSGRILVVVDALQDVSSVAAVMAALPPQAALLITTQQPDAVAAGLAPHIQVQPIRITGLTPSEGRRLVEQWLARPLSPDEWTSVQSVGESVDWHPEILRLAVAARETKSWAEWTADWQKADLPLNVDAVLERHWARMAGRHRRWIVELAKGMKRWGRFGVLFGVEMWGVEPEEAEQRLAELVQTGVIERLDDAVDLLRIDDALWQFTPLVRKKLGGALDETPPGEKGLRAALQDFWSELPRARWANRVYRYGGQVLKVPWQFAILVIGWWLLGSPIKWLVAVGLWLIEAVIGRRGWRERWWNWTILQTAERKLKAIWYRRGHEPAEEMWLLYDAWDVRSALWPIAVLAAMAVLLVLPVLWIATAENWLYLALRWWGITLMAAGAITLGITALPVSRRAWLAHLYGVEMWDLRMVLDLARWLGMSRPPGTS